MTHRVKNSTSKVETKVATWSVPVNIPSKSSTVNLSGMSPKSATAIFSAGPVAFDENFSTIDYIRGQKTAVFASPDPNAAMWTLVEFMAGMLDHMRSLVTQATPTIPTNSTLDPEEKERRRSIVLIGLDESNAGNEREKFKEDKIKVAEIMDELDVGCEPVHVYRMGIPNEGKSRLVKVVLPTSFFQSQCLKNAKKLKNSVLYQKVFIRPSRTKEQRQADYLLRQELKACREKKDGFNYYIKNDKVIKEDRNSKN